MHDSFPACAHLVTVLGSTLNRAATSPGVINLGGWPLPLLVNAGLVVFTGGGFPAARNQRGFHFGIRMSVDI